ncbi:MAG: DoxX family membrane protein [Promicromonosporaceae bacterium]|nr:DoxX family membrane protein [Promicromonosporaceae bacterium]
MLLHRLARPLLAAPFVYDGVQAVKRPDEHVGAARELTDQVTDRLGREPLSDKQVKLLVRAHGGATAILGVALGVGIFPRISALKLAALTTPLAVVHQPFTTRNRAERKEKTAKFVRAVGLVGAAAIAGVDTQGKPGIAWRVTNIRQRHAAGKATAGLINHPKG